MNSEDEFPVIRVTQEHCEASSDETMGTKPKFWIDHEELGCCLYKQVKRPNVGEDWSEKVASELCELLGLPHVTYHLAETWEGSRGVVSPCFLPKGGTLVHGNEILTPIVENYPTKATYRNSHHTIDNVLKVIEADNINLPLDWKVPSGIQKAVEAFVGYLLLDAWIGNGDRHHENWGFIQIKKGVNSPEKIHLAPTYDHASCLGRELSDEDRRNRQIDSYSNRCKSAFYASVEDAKPMKIFDVFQDVALRYPQAANIWLNRLESISKENMLSILNRIPQKNRISDIAVEFAQSILELNQNRLLNVRKLLK
ncbi:MAG TPA: HipA-like protein [Nostocaceae cyanobacterium]|nr:HipA-like protein [Nostocaceae cyanobacterium]